MRWILKKLFQRHLIGWLLSKLLRRTSLRHLLGLLIIALVKKLKPPRLMR